MNKVIYTLGDGFATGHIWPEWPQILQALLPDYNVVNLSAVGAGPEFLVTQLVNHIQRDSYVVFQWPWLKRLDKIVEDNNSWTDIINSDPLYHFNIVNDSVNDWWLSSASTQPQVRHYHKFYIGKKQRNVRLAVYRMLVKNTLENLNCVYCDITSKDQETYSNQERFIDLQQDQNQPSPAVHLHYTLEVILPILGIACDNDRVVKVVNKIMQTEWVAYHPDRASMVADLLR